MPQTNEPISLPRAKTDTTALALLGVMLLALASAGGASLSANGSNTIQAIVHATGIGRTAAIEAEQHRQLAALANLERTIQAVSVEVASINTRFKVADQDGVTATDRIALVEADIGALATELRSLRTPRQVETAPMSSWVADHLHNGVTGAQNDIASLRTSLDEHDRNYRSDIGAITTRLDRLEHMVTRDLTGSIRPPLRKKTLRRKTRAVGPAKLGVRTNDQFYGAPGVTAFSAPHSAWMRFNGSPAGTP